MASFNKEVQAKEEALKPKGPSGPKPGQKSLVVLAVIAALLAVGFGGWKVYQVLFISPSIMIYIEMQYSVHIRSYRDFWEDLQPKNLQEC